ncbi:MAG: hypothetical protein JXA25_00365 [Anaerolineales bacterium]|nr:hypothetical protein [Anaerolineales bacterium]
MKNIKHRQWICALIVSTLVLAGCGSQSLAQPPQHVFSCDIDTESYGFEITGEEGMVTTTSNNETTFFEYDDSGQMSGISVQVDRDMLFEDSQNNYHIEGTINIDLSTDEVSYDITATGDSFDDSPQTCKYP